ncbi:MAG: hypothetical protein WBX25_09275, partial [Rhodomicrobium sp.]
MNYFEREVRERLKAELQSRAGQAKHYANGAWDSLARLANHLTERVKRTPLPDKLARARSFIAESFLARIVRTAPKFWVSLAVVIAALLSSVATFLILNGLTSIIPTNDVVLRTLGINALFVLAIFGIIGFQIVKLLRARKRQTAGAGLHFRIAGVFSLVALFPAILLAIFATVSIDQTFDTFFSNRVKSIVNNTVEVAQAYMQESGQVIRSDMAGIAREVEE